MFHINDDNSNVHQLPLPRLSKTSTPVPAGLRGWVDEIQSLQLKIETAVSDALINAMAIGDILARAKIEVKASGGPRDRWGNFLDDCGLNHRTAQVYMQLAAGRVRIDAKMKEEPQRAADLSIRAGLKLLPPEKKASGPPTAYSAAVKAVAKLSEEERTLLIAEYVPVTVKADTKQNTVTPKDHSAEDRLVLAKDRLASLDKFIKSVHHIGATQATQKHKDAEILAKLAKFIKAYYMPPVRDRMDYRASSFIKKPGTAAVSLGSDTTTKSQTKH